LRNPTEELEDKLTELDPPYESLEEFQIGRMLDQYGIPFFYRQPTVVYHQGQNEIWQPSLTLSSYGAMFAQRASFLEPRPVCPTSTRLTRRFPPHGFEMCGRMRRCCAGSFLPGCSIATNVPARRTSDASANAF